MTTTMLWGLIVGLLYTAMSIEEIKDERKGDK